MPHDRQPTDSYDVAILGGGLAGLTLGHQLKQARPETSIFIAEKHGAGLSLVEARQTPAQGMENLFMEAIAQPA